MYFFTFATILGKMIQFEHIFQMGWFNHQLVVDFCHKFSTKKNTTGRTFVDLTSFLGIVFQQDPSQVAQRRPPSPLLMPWKKNHGAVGLVPGQRSKFVLIIFGG